MTPGTAFRVLTDGKICQGQNVGMRMGGGGGSTPGTGNSLQQGPSNFSPPWPHISITQGSLCNVLAKRTPPAREQNQAVTGVGSAASSHEQSGWPPSLHHRTLEEQE